MGARQTFCCHKKYMLQHFSWYYRFLMLTSFLLTQLNHMKNINRNGFCWVQYNSKLLFNRFNMLTAWVSSCYTSFLKLDVRKKSWCWLKSIVVELYIKFQLSVFQVIIKVMMEFMEFFSQQSNGPWWVLKERTRWRNAHSEWCIKMQQSLQENLDGLSSRYFNLCEPHAVFSHMTMSATACPASACSLFCFFLFTVSFIFGSWS